MVLNYITQYIGSYEINEKVRTTIPNITRITPVTRLSVLGVALFAKTAAILAQIKVNTIHSTKTVRSGIPPMAKIKILMSKTAVL